MHLHFCYQTDPNSRSLENSTQYFPSTDPWTWTAKNDTPQYTIGPSRGTIHPSTKNTYTYSLPTQQFKNKSKQNAKGPVRQTQPPPQRMSTTASNDSCPQDPSNNTVLERWINYWNIGNSPAPTTLQPQMGPFSPRIKPILMDNSISPNNPNPSLF